MTILVCSTEGTASFKANTYHRCLHIILRKSRQMSSHFSSGSVPRSDPLWFIIHFSSNASFYTRRLLASNLCSSRDNHRLHYQRPPIRFTRSILRISRPNIWNRQRWSLRHAQLRRTTPHAPLCLHLQYGITIMWDEQFGVRGFEFEKEIGRHRRVDPSGLDSHSIPISLHSALYCTISNMCSSSNSG
jgi:hypothetical protein